MNQLKAKLWTKDFIIVSSANFFLYLVFYLLLVTMAVYAVEEFAASESQGGLVTGVFIIGTLIGRLFLGRMISKIGNKRMLYSGLIFFILTSLLYFIDTGITFLLITRLLHGIALGMASTATGTIVAGVIPEERKGEGIGYYSMSITLATAIGPFIGLFMSEHTTYQVIFSFCLVLGIISLLIAFFLNVPEGKKKAQPNNSNKWSLSSFIEPKALPIALVVLIISLGYSSVLSFINFYAIEIDLVEIASLFFVVYAVAILVSRPFTGRLMDLKGANSVMYPAFILFGCGLLLLSTAENSIVLLLAGVLIGLGFGNMQSITQAIAVQVTPSHRVGLATSTYYISLDAGLGFGPYLLGMIIPFTGYRHLYIIMGLLVLATIVLYFFMHGKKEKSVWESMDSTVSSS
ncbi:Predicted arabinose efflux permease, MFS family [Salinibacillus kushneri]|uniref:Predicted arabinose efflux permease, MFS family n=1 Tax=Salinibacillus kushneri TaxID=237682 RepID=A0A1I0AED8_9BACI|nr:MFS transporter [Salinibacillus kushneri]SES92607.1 Predicted arabinose efflux permease, MFS family [Salinibacillus kushneri]